MPPPGGVDMPPAGTTGRKGSSLRSFHWGLCDKDIPLEEQPTSKAEASAWLALRKNTDGCRTKAIVHNSTTVIRQCVDHIFCAGEHGRTTDEPCGMMWRMDSAVQWALRVRFAHGSFDGQHAPQSRTTPTSRKMVFTGSMMEWVEDNLRSGLGPKKIHSKLLLKEVSVLSKGNCTTCRQHK